MLDFCVIGGGIVGLATARELLRVFPGCGLVVIEKEDQLGRHQTGHNSGVIHAGIYYAPGSLKARLCRAGAEATKAFCAEHGLAVETCGKMLVATSEAEVGRMNDLAQRAVQNGIEFERIDAAELRRREPHTTGLGALFVPSTGIVDYMAVCRAMAAEIRKAGGEIVMSTRIDAIEEAADSVTVHAGGRSWRAGQLVACAGLQADRVAALAGIERDFRIVPFRGEYFRLPDARSGLVNSLIYPIPDPTLPFLGIHLTRMIDGSITVGPNAVLGWAREGYPQFSFDINDVADFVSFPGFWKAIRRHLSSGLVEMRNSLWRRGYLEMCRRYCPDLTLDDLMPYEAGIRAQAVMADGSFMHDFLIRETARTLHVCNAPSPAATSAMPIGQMIVETVQERRKALGMVA